MDNSIKSMTIEGFKSIRKLDKLELHPLTILIGANGCGKSNFLSFFRLLGAIYHQKLRERIAEWGGADRLLFMGPQVTNLICASVESSDYRYSFALKPTAVNEMIFAEDQLLFMKDQKPSFPFYLGDVAPGSGHMESLVRNSMHIQDNLLARIAGARFYHFSDMGVPAAARRSVTVRHDEALSPDGGNIAAFLAMLKDQYLEHYNRIRDTVRTAAPFIDDFLLRPRQVGQDVEVLLEWKQPGSNYPFHPAQISDGTLRFICLATALLQPGLEHCSLLLDEPELGLHPFAIGVLAGLIKSAAAVRQVFVSTQSPALLDHFDPEDVIVVNRRDGASQFQRLDRAALQQWLEEYTLGELWQKNYVEGGIGNG